MAENTNEKNPKNANPDQKPRQPPKPNTERDVVKKTPKMDDKMDEEIGTRHEKQSDRGQSGSNVGKSSPSEDLDDEDIENGDAEKEVEDEDRITQRTPSQRNSDEDPAMRK